MQYTTPGLRRWSEGSFMLARELVLRLGIDEAVKISRENLWLGVERDIRFYGRMIMSVQK